MSEDEKDFRLKYIGARFKGTRMPVDVLSDLAAFRDLLVAFAKDEWRGTHVDRQRVPKGFDKSIAFDLVAIEPGSAVPKLNWNRQTAQANLPGLSDELEIIVDSSFRDVLKLIDDAGNNTFPKTLSSEHIRALNRLGSSLREDEKIEFPNTSGRDGNVVYLDSFRRKSLITRVRETYQSRFEGVGELIGSSAPHDSIGLLEVKTAEHGNIKIPLASDRIKEDFDGPLYSAVQFDLQIELDNNDRYRSIIDVFDVAIIGEQHEANLATCRARLEELRNLESGWHDGEGDPITSDALSGADKLIERRPALAALFRIFPTEDGGVAFEFIKSGWDVTIEFKPNGAIEFYGVQIDGTEEIEPREFKALDDEFFSALDDRLGR